MSKKHGTQIQKMAANLNSPNNGQLFSSDQRKLIDGLPPKYQTMQAASMLGANHQKEIDSLLTDALIDFQHMIHELNIPIVRAETVRSMDVGLTKTQRALQNEKGSLEKALDEVNQMWEIARRALKKSGDADTGDFKHAYPHLYQNVLVWISALDKLAAGDELPFRNAPTIDFMSQVQQVARAGKAAKDGRSVIRHRGLELQAEKLSIMEIAVAIQAELEAMPQRSDGENQALNDLQSRHRSAKSDYVGQILREKK